MYGKVISSALIGIEGIPVSVEADVNDGLPSFTMVGYLSSSVKEAGERVRTALKNSGFHLPPKRITINLSPGNIRKDGTGYDLAVAVSVLSAMGVFGSLDLSHYVMIGELGLDGSVKAVPGVLPMVHGCLDKTDAVCFVPASNVREASLARKGKVVGVSTLKEAVDCLNGHAVPAADIGQADAEMPYSEKSGPDFSDIQGQEMLKRGMEIAAAGFHNVLMTGAAGAGKSMLASGLPGIMPELSFEEKMEVTKIYSVAGLLADTGNLMEKRPFRAPHHTISNHALVGGGVIPRPGEISLAHRGVLFLDELPEFQKNALEVLRQPMEERRITISRVNATYEFPADFMLVAAMNPCPCGYYPDRSRCACTSLQIARYQSKISGPLSDRIDIHMAVKPVPYRELFENDEKCSSEEIRARVEAARKRQGRRYKDERILSNSELNGKLLKKYIVLGTDEHKLLESAFQNHNLSARGAYRVLRLARTIADLDEAERIGKQHLLEAIFYRNGEVQTDERQ